MSAGSGVFHSEHNFAGGMLRFLQIWFLPDQKNYPPDYGDVQFKATSKNPSPPSSLPFFRLDCVVVTSRNSATLRLLGLASRKNC